jgi:hypothetical protein
MSGLMMAEMAILALSRCSFSLADSVAFSPNERNEHRQSSARKKLSNAQMKHDAANEVKLGEIPSSVVRDKCFLSRPETRFQLSIERVCFGSF